MINTLGENLLLQQFSIVNDENIDAFAEAAELNAEKVDKKLVAFERLSRCRGLGLG